MVITTPINNMLVGRNFSNQKAVIIVATKRNGNQFSCVNLFLFNKTIKYPIKGNIKHIVYKKFIF
jgi:hypothetical protein